MEPKALDRIRQELSYAVEATAAVDNVLVKVMGFSSAAQTHLDNARGLMSGTHHIGEDGEIYENA